MRDEWQSTPWRRKAAVIFMAPAAFVVAVLLGMLVISLSALISVVAASYTATRFAFTGKLPPPKVDS